MKRQSEQYMKLYSASLCFQSFQLTVSHQSRTWTFRTRYEFLSLNISLSTEPAAVCIKSHMFSCSKMGFIWCMRALKSSLNPRSIKTTHCRCMTSYPNRTMSIKSINVSLCRKPLLTIGLWNSSLTGLSLQDSRMSGLYVGSDPCGPL